MEKIWIVTQHSVVNGEHLFNVTPCFDYDVARAVMLQEVNTLLNESPKYKDAKRYISDETNQQLTDEDWDNCPYEFETDNDNKFYIGTLYDDYSELIEIEEKDIKR
jgi:hypothetical protein